MREATRDLGVRSPDQPLNLPAPGDRDAGVIIETIPWIAGNSQVFDSFSYQVVRIPTPHNDQKPKIFLCGTATANRVRVGVANFNRFAVLRRVQISEQADFSLPFTYDLYLDWPGFRLPAQMPEEFIIQRSGTADGATIYVRIAHSATLQSPLSQESPLAGYPVYVYGALPQMSEWSDAISITWPADPIAVGIDPPYGISDFVTDLSGLQASIGLKVVHPGPTEFIDGSTLTAGGSTKWNALIAPDGALGLNMAAYATDFAWNAATGANDLFTLRNTANDTGTGALLKLATPGTTNAKTPFAVVTNDKAQLDVFVGGSEVVRMTGAGTEPSIQMFRAGGNLTTKAAVPAGSEIGAIDFRAYLDATSVWPVAAIAAVAGATTFDVSNWPTGLHFRTSNSNLAPRNRLIITPAGFVGVGENLSFTDITAARFQVTHAPTDATYAAIFSHALSNTAPIGNSFATSITFSDGSAATYTDARVLNLLYSHPGTSSFLTATAYGIRLEAFISQNQSNWYGAYLRGAVVASGKTLSNAYGLYIAATSGAGTITNNYSVFVEAGAGRAQFNSHLNVGVQAGDMSSPINGDVSYNSTSGTFRFYQNGTWAELGGGAQPAGTGTELQTRFNATTFAAVPNSSLSGGVITLQPALNILGDGVNSFLTFSAWGTGLNPTFNFIKGNGSNALPTQVLSGDVLGSIAFFGQYSSTVGQYTIGASIVAQAAGTFFSTVNKPTDLLFKTDNIAHVTGMILRSDSRVVIGPGVVRADATHGLTVKGSGHFETALELQANTNTTFDIRAFGGTPAQNFTRGNGTMASPTRVLTNNLLGSITFYGQYDNAPGNTTPGAEIRAEAVGDFLSASNKPTDLVFLTDSTSHRFGLRLTSDSRVVVGLDASHADAVQTFNVKGSSRFGTFVEFVSVPIYGITPGLEARLFFSAGAKALLLSIPDDPAGLFGEPLPVLTSHNTQTVFNKTLGIGTLFQDGIRMTFNPDNTNAGLNVGAHSSEPTSPLNGDVIYNSTLGLFRFRQAGSWIGISASVPGGAPGTLQFNNSGAFGAVTSSAVSGPDVALGGSVLALTRFRALQTITVASAAQHFAGSLEIDNAGTTTMSGADFIAVRAKASSSTTTTSPQSLIGVYSDVRHQQVSAVGGLSGFQADLICTGASTASIMSGFTANLTIGSSRAVTEMYAMKFTLNGGISGSVATAYGFRVDIQPGLTTFTTAYGIYLSAAPSGITNKYGIVVDSNAGNSGFGLINPAAKLHVSGSTRFDLGSDVTGDFLYRNSSGFLTARHPTTNGFVLTLVGGLPDWVAPAAGGGTPGGSSGQIEWNNAGAFAGISNSFVVGGDVGLGVTPSARLHLADNSTIEEIIERASTDALGPVRRFRKSRGNLAGRSLTVADDVVGSLSWQAWDGVAHRDVAMIRSAVDASSAAGDMPGGLEFLTTKDGTTTLARAMRITSGQRVGIGEFLLPGDVQSLFYVKCPSNSIVAARIEADGLTTGAALFQIANGATANSVAWSANRDRSTTQMFVNGESITFTEITGTITTSSGSASLFLFFVVPVGFMLLGVTTRILDNFTTENGLTSLNIGDGTTVDLFAFHAGIGFGNTTHLLNHNSIFKPKFYNADDAITVTAVGGTFGSGGSMRISMIGYTLGPPNQ